MSVQGIERATKKRFFIIPFIFRVVAPLILVLGFLGYCAFKVAEIAVTSFVTILALGVTGLTAGLSEYAQVASDEQLPVLHSWLTALEHADVVHMHRLMTPTAAEPWTAEHVEHLASLLASDHGAVEEVVPLLGQWQDVTVGEPSNDNRVISQEWGIVYERGTALAKVKMTLLDGSWLIDELEIEFKPMGNEIEESRKILQSLGVCGNALSP